MNISSFKGIAPAAAFAALDPHAESLADGIGSSYGIVGYKGKVWSLRLRGETYMFVRPDDGSPAAFLDVIILRQLPNKSKSYYPKDTYQDGAIGIRPVCAALDGITPDADIAEPQSNACAICPRNVFKINPEGRKTRECSDYKRLAVLILPSMTKALLGAPLMEPVFLRVPAASLNDLALMGEGMSAQGFHYSSYITRIGFNPEKPHPQMTFRALQALTNKEGPVVLPLREDPTALRITGENEVGKSRPAAIGQVQPGSAAQPQSQPDPAAAAIVAAANAAAAAKEAQVEKDLREAKAAEAAREAAAAKTASAPVDTGFGDVGETASPSLQPAQTLQTGAVDGFDTSGAGVATQTSPTMNTVSDTGAPEDADADLDARIAALLPK
jgi:hypothetical protein